LKGDFNMENEIRKKKFETLLLLANYKPEKIHDLLRFILEELVSKTRSQKGYVFKLDEKNQTFELDVVIDQTGVIKPDNDQLVFWPLSNAGPWIKSINKNGILVMNNDSKLFPLNDDKITFEVSERSCSLSVKQENSINAVLVVSDKETDYDVSDIEYLEFLDEQLSNIIGNMVVIESLKRAKEDAEKKEKLKSYYLNNLAHEIKSPVNAISGFSNLLKENIQSIEYRNKFLDIIIESSGNLVSIINTVVEISNFESGVVSIVEKNIDLNDLIKEVYDAFCEEASKKKLLFQTEVNIPLKDCIIVSDKERLKQVLSGLLSNSFRFTYSGKIVFGCKLKDASIEFFVSDTGSGISEENKKSVYDHFFQAGDSISKTYKGIGLGLTIAKGYVEKMGGRMDFISSEGKGTDFYFTVPFKRASLKPESKFAVQNEVDYPPDKRKTILVADDDNLNYTLITNFLEKLNVELLRAENGKIAVELCNANQFDLILMDIRMPVMDGYTATRLIKENSPEQIIIAQTAYTNDRETALANGCDDFLAKPFSKDQLLSVVNAYL
jgi:signal transduction histidine kinase